MYTVSKASQPAVAQTLADVVVPRPSDRTNALLRDGALIVGFSLFVALCAKISIPLGFTPVPITLQTLAVLLAGASLGSKRGALAMLLYLAEGAAGLPVFAAGGGLSYFAGPTAGYLLSYPIAAFLVGFLAERRWDRRLLTASAAMLLGNIVIYLIGMSWLGIYKGTLFQVPTLVAGVLPFIPGDLLKIAVAAVVLPSAWLLTGKQ